MTSTQTANAPDPLDPDLPGDRPAPSRRTILRAAGGAGLLGTAAAVGGWRMLDSGAAQATAQSASPYLSSYARSVGAPCAVLTPEVTEGPFYLPGELIRRDIREHQEGFELRLKFRVMNSTTCKLVRKAAVDIWHCNAVGEYSGVAQAAEGLEPTDSDSYLRGIQLTDAAGDCRFTTIVPGWYPGRAVHIHLKVHVGGHVSDHMYVGGRVCHTGQVFFSEKLLRRIETRDPYSQNSASRVLNVNDSIYHQAGEESAIARTHAFVAGDPTQGYRGAMILGVDPSADD